MNYDEIYDIRLAKKEDIDSIMKFIETEWKKGHILSSNREFFEYEFLEDNGDVNFMIAVRKETNEIESIIGFIKASHNKEKTDLWDVMWKTKDNNLALLGVELIKRRRNFIDYRYDMSVGDNVNTAVPLFKYVLKRNIFKMKHFYMLSNIDDFVIADIKNRKDVKTIVIKNNDIEISPIKDVNDMACLINKCSNVIPYKDIQYIEYRYFNYPIYKYNVYGIKFKDELVSAFVTRNEIVKDRIAIRIVDYIGDYKYMSDMSQYIKSNLFTDNIEYCDIYFYGIDNQLFIDAGFIEVEDDDLNIIPNYFHPFEKSNIDIWCDSEYENTVFFKADGDQDRPN